MASIEAERDGDRDNGRVGVLAAISKEMVRLYKDQFGRGPNRVRTYWCGDDRMAEHQRLRDTRTFFQYASVREFCEPIERLSGRTVKAFISGIDTEVDGLSTETFILHPAGSDAPSRTERAEP
jgi:uncharacterized protein YbcI